MAAGTIITVLSNIPWKQVVQNAPMVADGAAKLWKAVASRKKSRPVSDSGEGADNMDAFSELEILEQRLATLEENVRSLQDQMQASAELIKTLAEQNTLLVERIELNRQKMIRFAAAGGAMGLVLLGLLAYLLVR